MSPEQAGGAQDLDERTDMYSLALVVYEMLTGEPPGGWPSEESVRTGRFLDAPPAHRARMAQVGGVVEGALVRGMAIRHDQRTTTPATLIEELRGSPAPRRRFSESEVQEIVRRAAELEASNPTASGALTVGGVEALAAEVGIAPEIVRQAARSLASPAAAAEVPAVTANRDNPWTGGPTRLACERVVEGEVPDAEFPYLVEEIRRVLGHPGQVSQLGRTFSWTSMRGAGSTRNIEVAVMVRGGRTRISAHESLGALMGGIFGGVGGGVGGGGLGMIIPLGQALIGGMGPLAIIPLWLASVYAGTRAIFRRAARRRRSELDALVDRLAELARELVPGPLPGGPSTPRRLGA